MRAADRRAGVASALVAGPSRAVRCLMISYRQRGTVLTDHTFSVPLDHGRPGGERIEIFAREVVAAGRAGQELPWLLFLQGGPGFSGPRLSGRGS